MLSRLWRFLRADALPNTGSLARDMLAAERTCLSWQRTGLGFVALGVALERAEAFAALSPALRHLQGSRTKLAAGVFIASGTVFVAHGTRRYFSTLDLVKRGRFRPNAAGVTMTAVVTVGIAVAGALTAVLENGREQAEREKSEGAERVA